MAFVIVLLMTELTGGMPHEGMDDVVDGEKKVLRLERVVINGLFGRFNYDIVLKEGGITLLTGPYQM